MRGQGLSDTTKGELRAAVAEIREKLLADIRVEAERRYQFDVELEAPPDPTADDAGANRAWREKADRVLQTDARLRAGLRADRCVLEKHLTARAHAGVPRERALCEAIGESAATTLQRLVLVRHLEATGLLPMKLITGVERSEAYVEALAWMPSLVGRPDDPSKGFAGLLDLLFAELARDLPGLFGEVGTTRLFPAPGATLLQVLERLDAPELVPAWDDDTTLGWVYQFWNAPEKERIDAKIGEGDDGGGKGKVEAHEIAPKTALYTERYMVEWLLQNSLGPMWLAICAKRGWVPDARVALNRLAAGRADGTVHVEDDLEDRWRYHVEAPLTDAFVDAAPESVRKLKLLDPAVGSGHFLVAAFDWLFPVWQEEARHRGETWSDAEIASGIVESNLHGIDIDPVAVRLAAAAVWLKARLKGAHPTRLNLVAAQFEMGRLSDAERKAAAERISEATPLDPDQVEKLLGALSRADVLGSLLDVDRLDERGIQQLVSREFAVDEVGRPGPRQGRLFDLHQPAYVRQTALTMLRSRLAGLSRTDDLGVRLGAEQVEAGLRFATLARSRQYDVVVANPPYLGARKAAVDVKRSIRAGDLCADFLLRGLQLARPSGLSAMIALRGWMFLKQFSTVRSAHLDAAELRLVADLHYGAFSAIKDVSVVMSVSTACRPALPTLFLRAVEDMATVVRDVGQPERNAIGLTRQAYRRTWALEAFKVIKGNPLPYWWSDDFLRAYANADKLETVARVRQGMATCDNGRFVLSPWEVEQRSIRLVRFKTGDVSDTSVDWPWVPYVKGAAGRVWFEQLDSVLRFRSRYLEVRVFNEFLWGSYTRTIKNEAWYFKEGVTFTKIGTAFLARVYDYESVFDVAGSSVFPDDAAETCVLMNSPVARYCLQSLNPTVNFQVGDVNRLPVFAMPGAARLFAVLRASFEDHEHGRESSVEFVAPAPSTWRSAQEWANDFLSRDAEGVDAILEVEPPSFDAEMPPASAHMSYAVGHALGRFAGRAIPGGILFAATRGPDNVDQAHDLLAAWTLHGSGDLRQWLRERFFTEDHLDRYEKRPIHWPLSSKGRNFVAWVCIHSWTDDTLERVRADHVAPCLRALEGELADLRSTPPAGKKARGKDPVTELTALVEELRAFDRLVARVASEGPDVAKQEVKAPFRMELEDGVRVNIATLHPLLAPQWKEPTKWWGEIVAGRGKKAAFWSRTAARYWPRKVTERCEAEPSHAVAHRCFWRYHPAVAWKWELQLQDEIGAHYRHDEPDADGARMAWLTGFPELALAGLVKEAARRRRKLGRAVGDPFVVEVFERGIWAAIAGEVWDAELKLIKSMKRDVRLVDPDEPDWRAAWVAADPRRARARDMLVAEARAEQLRLLDDESEDQEEDVEEPDDDAEQSDDSDT